MPVLNNDDLHYNLPTGSRLFGIDLGSKTIGLSLSDISLMIASPFKTILRRKLTIDLNELFLLADKNNVAGLVIGLPLNMNGSSGPRVQSTKDFVYNLLKYRNIDVAFWDERLSTAVVERMLVEADLSRKRRDIIVDKLAAAYILQGFLDARAKKIIE